MVWHFKSTIPSGPGCRPSQNLVPFDIRSAISFQTPSGIGRTLYESDLGQIITHGCGYFWSAIRVAALSLSRAVKLGRQFKGKPRSIPRGKSCRAACSKNIV